MNGFYAVGILCIVLLCFWQLKIILKLDRNNNVKIDIKRQTVNIDGQTINFNDIQSVSVVDGEELNFFEKHFDLGIYNYCCYNIEFELKNGFTVTGSLNKKYRVYNLLIKLSPYIKINNDITQYAPKNSDFGIMFYTWCFVLFFWLYIIIKHIVIPALHIG